MLTSVIIPCWNALELTSVAVGQVLRWTGPSYELVLVDNGSTDGTRRWLAALARRKARGALKRVTVLRNPRNRGYPAAMNQGIRAARGSLLVFGNADAAVGPGWLEGMREALEAERRVGGVSPACNRPGPAALAAGWASPPLYRDLRGFERFAAARLIGERETFRRARGFVPGFWFLTRRDVLREVGSFDEAYFSPGGFEDWDLQWRIRRAGWRLGFAPRVYSHHVGFACYAKNGRRGRDVYGEGRLARVHERHPRAATLSLETLSP